MKKKKTSETKERISASEFFKKDFVIIGIRKMNLQRWNQVKSLCEDAMKSNVQIFLLTYQGSLARCEINEK